MLATLHDEPFSDPAWVFERKLDGVRVLAFRRHVRSEFEWRKADLRIDLAANRIQRRQKRLQADHAPGTGDVGDEVDTEGLGRHQR